MKTASIRQRFGPSLARRVFLAIIISNTIVLLFIFFKTMVINQSTDVQASMRWIERGSYRLNQLSTETDAHAFGVAWTKGSYCPVRCYAEVWTRDGRRIYASRNLPDEPPFIGVNNKATKIVIGGESYDLFRHDGSRWSLRIASRERDLLSVLFIIASLPQRYLPPWIFFLFLIPPLWFAVNRGLYPLRSLATHLGQRPAGDLTPLNFKTPYRELKPLVTALDALLSQLRSKVQREYAFLQDATHELRTPIAVIAVEAHNLARAATPLAQLAAKQQIDHAMARAAHLIAQLSELARIDTLSLKAIQVLDVVALVKLDLMQMDQSAQAHRIKLVLEAPDTLLYPLESNTFQSILHNLVSNAIRYGRLGGMIAVTLKQEGDNLRLSVADDGQGISAGQREQVFERFYRGIGHEVSGSGLGLAIVRQAAVRLNAKLDLGTGLLGRGCCFSVLIPKNQTITPPTAKPGESDEKRDI